MSPWQIEVFYDGLCPLCAREINILRWLDRNKKIRFTDIASPEFDPSSLGFDFDTLMARIHGRLPNGTFVEGVEVFRRLYGAVGFGPVVWVSRWPGISHLLDLAYTLFAKNRLRFTGRCQADSCSIASHA